MKDLTIEEKAKAYDKAIDKIVDVVEAGTIEQGFAEWLFPELKESEGEKTRKEIINYLKKNCRLEWAAWLEKQGEQKPTEWSEEDKRMFDYALDMIEWYGGKNEKRVRLVSDWLKSLKNRVLPQPKQEWTEEDKRILDALITSLINERFAGHLEFLKGIKVSSVIDWVKSLKNKIKKEAV